MIMKQMSEWRSTNILENSFVFNEVKNSLDNQWNYRLELPNNLRHQGGTSKFTIDISMLFTICVYRMCLLINTTPVSNSYLPDRLQTCGRKVVIYLMRSYKEVNPQN